MNENYSGNNTGKWIAIGCVSLLVLALCCVGGTIGGVYWLGSQSTQGLAQIEVSVPSTVEQEGAITIVIEIRNVSGREIRLNSVDITKGFLDGFVIESVEPSYIETYTFRFGGETFQTYSFDTVILAGGSLTVRLEGTAVLPGDFSGEMDVCINSTFNCNTSIIRTIVR
jgi:hypothetical protein